LAVVGQGQQHHPLLELLADQALILFFQLSLLLVAGLELFMMVWLLSQELLAGMVDQGVVAQEEVLLEPAIHQPFIQVRVVMAEDR